MEVPIVNWTPPRKLAFDSESAVSIEKPDPAKTEKNRDSRRSFPFSYFPSKRLTATLPYTFHSWRWWVMVVARINSDGRTNKIDASIIQANV